jgi:hypothetical protein
MLPPGRFYTAKTHLRHRRSDFAVVHNNPDDVVG